MKQRLNRSLGNLRTTFTSFTLGQQVVAVVGTMAILLAAFMVFRWVSTPDYAPLYSNLAASDASAIVDELDSQGTPYKLANGGSTIMVPRDSVYSTRISLSGQGLPEQGSAGGGDGYSLLDNQDISTSEFQEQTDFKRAMEGELASTIEAVDGVSTAVVHLALPPAKVFADEQDPPTASVLIDTAAGATFEPQQVQAIVHLVASSIDGLDPDNVTVADSSGKVLSSSDAGALGASTRDQQVTTFQQQTSQRIQAMLDRVLGPGNSTVQVTADLDFDKSVSESTTYGKNAKAPLSSSSSTEKYDGPAGGSSSTGVVGPDGQMDSFGTTANGKSSYVKESQTSDNAVETTVEHRETAPGSVNSLHVGVVLDTVAAQGLNATDVQDLITAAVGINPNRGDTVQVTTMPFDRTADKAAAAELAAAAKAAKTARMWDMVRNGGIALAVLAMLLIAWLRGRRKAKRRDQNTTYLVEQLRSDAADRAAATAAVMEASPALAALESADNASSELRRELADLAEDQPEDVAALLRGWLVERP
ncbi:flagellar basal-body MS-ring/collar protein FliF [Nocardioides sp. T2.26MG-1]|uniref:flagellar basal-body MS-ring/collar protein FliF n=1 Tax=Nocardioides sp. T2.26MG-1 TaxID=3041166 RepID=UPI002477793B|nr:flagellar basal-body MS-ring/collar protein FliF [Nocardioides sp. T2.26MG-1]CAI9399274.1 Flagellar M-ring protein [Nocardioides sp. T2.26MG-1]